MFRLYGDTGWETDFGLNELAEISQKRWVMKWILVNEYDLSKHREKEFQRKQPEKRQKANCIGLVQWVGSRSL